MSTSTENYTVNASDYIVININHYDTKEKRYPNLFYSTEVVKKHIFRLHLFKNKFIDKIKDTYKTAYFVLDISYIH